MLEPVKSLQMHVSMASPWTAYSIQQLALVVQVSDGVPLVCV
jgi:hypothetical protein